MSFPVCMVDYNYMKKKTSTLYVYIFLKIKSLFDKIYVHACLIRMTYSLGTDILTFSNKS